MSDNKLSTDSYKGVRDFYPEDMAVQRYIFDTWAKTAESFGYERYDASILEPSDLYRAKGAENEEMVNEQTYTFTDRGDREVTLRPEMTPTVARMVAKKRRELAFPLRWYCVSNFFRYERPQRGRLREFWQFNCDIFGGDEVAADIEAVTLAYQTMLDFGATPDMFTILLNDRAEMGHLYAELGITDQTTVGALTQLNDRKNKLSPEDYQTQLLEILKNEDLATQVSTLVEDTTATNPVLEGLHELGITNSTVNRTIARGFNYYTGTVFEIVDTSGENNRAMLGGGRYDNLTGMFGGEPVSGVGFGMGDIIMRDFLETHNLLPEHVKSTAPNLIIIPMGAEQNLFALKTASIMRKRNPHHSVSIDTGTKKIGDKISRAAKAGSQYVIVIGEDEVQTGKLTIKHLDTGETEMGDLSKLSL
jgi:histidyl-tRNA synthetase